jgi:hypothetical protein
LKARARIDYGDKASVGASSRALTIAPATRTTRGEDIKDSVYLREGFRCNEILKTMWDLKCVLG